jgi:hypothetical protein
MVAQFSVFVTTGSIIGIGIGIGVPPDLDSR